MPRILIVEDSPTMRSLLIAALDELSEPAKIVEVQNGFEALRLLPRGSWDLIITDINMPDINGLELVSFIKKSEAHRGVPLIIVSTESAEGDRARGLSLGADAYIVKPFEPQELRDLAEDLLARAGEAGER